MCRTVTSWEYAIQLTAEDCSPIEGIRYLRAEGPAVSARLPAPGGLGIRRTALSAVLAEKARAVGVCIAEGQSFESLDRSTKWHHRRKPRQALASTFCRCCRWSFITGATPARVGKTITLRRYGLRRHFHITPWTQHVEVYVKAVSKRMSRQPAASASASPFVGQRPDRTGGVFPSLLARFPALRDQIGNAPPDSTPQGAGPLLRRATQLYDDRVALVGDAAGYVDAITGEGLSLALPCAMSLASVLPGSHCQQRPDHFGAMPKRTGICFASTQP